MTDEGSNANAHRIDIKNDIAWYKRDNKERKNSLLRNDILEWSDSSRVMDVVLTGRQE